jgi:pimeloyl-ACP methyl ester carboxylesterase
MGREAEVVLVHGLWFGPGAMAWLAGKLVAEGYAVRRFAYSTTTDGLAVQARRLADYARASQAVRQHFIGHSLGGLVTLRMLASEVGIPTGRVVLLGTPLGGSIVARKSRRVPGGGKLLGQARPALEEGYAVLPADRDTGMIAGSRSVGLGLLLGGAGRPGDGTVAVRETRHAGLKDHLVGKMTHTGMLFSAQVARQSAHFLKNGCFKR